MGPSDGETPDGTPESTSVDPATLARNLADTPQQADFFVDAWLRRFRSVKDRSLRRGVLVDCVNAADDATLLATLHRLEQRALDADGDARWALAELALAPGVLGELPYERLVELYGIARKAGLGRVAARFLGHVSPGEDEPVQKRLDEDGAPMAAPPVENRHFEASPGLRIAAARGRDRQVLDRLMHDRDLRVVTALLDNPRIVERDVVRIAAMRPTTADILQAIAAHPRWASRAQVRRALVFNPATPFPLARQLLPAMLRQDLDFLAGSPMLAEPLRHEARLLLSRARRG